MRKYFWSVLTLIVIWPLYHKVTRGPHPTTLNPRYLAPEINPKALEKAKSYVVLISNEGFMGIGRGTGVIIDSHTVLTCAHLIPDGDEEMWVYTYPVHTVYKAHLRYSDRGNDLALFDLNTPVELPYYPVFQPHVDEGEALVVIGNILGSMRWFISYGIVTGRDWQFVLTDALIRGGNSGGPWLNYKGEIVAISDWTMEIKGKDTGIHGGVSGKTILNFLEEAKHPNPFQILLGML